VFQFQRSGAIPFLDELFTVGSAHWLDARLGKLETIQPSSLHRTWARGHDIGAMLISADQFPDLLRQLGSFVAVNLVHPIKKDESASGI
jgi:hypothetical protein